MRIIEGQSRPNSPTGASNDNWPRGSPSAAHGSIHCPGHNVRSKRTAAVRLDHPRRLARRLPVVFLLLTAFTLKHFKLTQVLLCW